MATLKLLSGENVGELVRLNRESTTLGRHPNCDIVLADETISRRHARIVSRSDGYYMEDLDSRNGTFLNGRKVATPTRLCHMDEIQLFHATFAFLDDPSEVESEQSQRRTVQSDRFVRPPTRPGALFETLIEIDVEAYGATSGHRASDAKLQAVLEITRSLRSSLEPDEIIARIVDCVTHVFPYFSRFCLLRHDEKTDELITVADKHASEDVNGAMTLLPISQTLARQVLATGKAVLSIGIAGGGEADAGDSVLEPANSSLMCAPLIGPSHRSIGILYIETVDHARRYRHDDLEVFACVAILAGQAIEQVTWFGARYRAVVDTAVDGIITFDENGTVESVNPAVLNLFGFAPRELIGANVNRLMTEPAREGSDVSSQPDGRCGLLKYVGIRRELVAHRKNGSTFPIDLSIGEYALGGQRRYTGIVHDVSERHEAEAALRKLNELLENLVRERTEYISLLQDVAVIANEAESVEQAFHAVVPRIFRFRNWDVAHLLVRSAADTLDFVDSGIWTLAPGGRFKSLIAATAGTVFRPGQGLIGRVVATSRPEWIANLALDDSYLHGRDAAECGLNAAVGCPIFNGNEVVAVVEFFSSGAAPPDEKFLDLMQHVGTQLGRVIERERLQKQLVDAVWDQHRRFGQELHDTLGQALTGIGMLTDSVARKLRAPGHPEAAKLDEVVSMIQQAKSEVRQLAKGLYPVDVDAQGLLTALEDLCVATEQRCGIRCVFEGDSSVQIQDNEVATHLFRIAQEAVHNAVRHANPKRISITLTRHRGRVTLAIRDDGTGILPQPIRSSGGLGLRIMQYRAKAIGADLLIEASRRGGTCVRCALKKEADHVATNGH
ncbi:MAG: PAS domain S-box protein [Planctomycetaceae bacterium]|nr:PAS domain S-box protein [Planctomycetaceae bacterium]